VLKLRQDWQKLFGEARTRILLWNLLLMGFFVAVSLPSTRQRVFDEVNARVRRDLVEEIETFEVLLEGKYSPEEEELFDRLAARSTEGDMIPYGKPKTTLQLTTLFEVYLRRRVPDDDTFLITIVNGDFYQSSPRALPQEFDRNSPLMEEWKNLPVEFPIPSGISIREEKDKNVLYITKKISIDQDNSGVIIAAHTTAGEKQEALDALQIVVEVKLTVILLVLALTWLAAGKILAPLRELSETAHQISETDLGQRLPVRGSGEIAELSRTFNEMMDRLSAAFTAQREFINDAGHELRTPITIIRGNLELMGDDPQEQEETIALVIDELDRMNRLVEDLLLLAKSERPDFLQLEIVDIEGLTQELLMKAKALADRQWQLEEIAQGKIPIDRQRITEAVLNLAENASQYTQKTDTIAIGSKIDRDCLYLWVRDTGEGVNPKDRERIFERFARASNSRRRSDGSGLGLSIVRAIVEAHHGKVNLISELGTGSTFVIVLPL
jgi:signal transduction histidine kinase